MTALRTDKALAERRRCLKPLLAQVLTGEPWQAALSSPSMVPAAVVAACVVSYISRRIEDWERLPVEALPETLTALVVNDRRLHQAGEWPFLDALENLLPKAQWPEVFVHLAPYRLMLNSPEPFAYSQKERGGPKPAAHLVPQEANLCDVLTDGSRSPSG